MRILLCVGGTVTRFVWSKRQACPQRKRSDGDNLERAAHLPRGRAHPRQAKPLNQMSRSRSAVVRDGERALFFCTDDHDVDERRLSMLDGVGRRLADDADACRCSRLLLRQSAVHDDRAAHERERVDDGGELGGRVDHTLSTLGILEMLNKTGRRGMVTDGKNRVRLLQNGSLLLARDVRYRYLSLLTLSEKAKGVSLEGCKYPLHGATLTRTRQYAVSNEITGNAALIAVRRGTLLVVESAD